MIETTKPGGWSPWRIALWLTIATLLVAPLAAMQVTDEVAWTSSDFAAAAILLIGAGLAFELTARSPLKTAIKLTLAAAVLALVLVVWADGAVGVF